MIVILARKDEMDVSVDELRTVASCGQIRESTPNYTGRRAPGSTRRKIIHGFRRFPQIENFRWRRCGTTDGSP
jgi:hypothetical protein